jgi:ribulose 1,5-bisphosphate carboxylase large subunit-like protein
VALGPGKIHGPSLGGGIMYHYYLSDDDDDDAAVIRVAKSLSQISMPTLCEMQRINSSLYLVTGNFFVRRSHRLRGMTFIQHFSDAFSGPEHSRRRVTGKSHLFLS